MDRFIDCVCDNDLLQLVISGEPSKEELQKAWDGIYIEYCQLSQDGSYNETLELMREIADLKAKISIVNNILQYLQIKFDAELIILLNKFALRCDINESDKGETLIDKLNSVLARMKKWFPKLNQRERELEKLHTANAGKIDREYFDSWLDAISINYGFLVEASKITVSRFCRGIVKLNTQSQKDRVNNLKKVG